MNISESIHHFSQHLRNDRILALTLLVSALGYFVDVFDLLLFSIVRIQSLRDLGVDEADLLTIGIDLLNAQMAGLLLGGIFFGVIGDKFGRVSVLFASIILYSLGSIANGFVTTITQYEILRFITGFGLAGELGICITLVSELLPKNVRGLGTAFIAAVGVLGAGAAAIVTKMVDWRTAYIIGGILGLGLLLLRMKLRESHLYRKMEDEHEEKARGDLMLFFRSFERLKRYLTVILIGAPIWAVLAIMIMITFTVEFAKSFGMTTLPDTGMAILSQNIGTALGIVAIGLLSQHLHSRKKAIGIFLVLSVLAVTAFVTVRTDSLAIYYSLCVFLGFAIGYWSMVAQSGAEQFGTNLRATATTSIPNFIRAFAIPSTMLFHALTPSLGIPMSGLAVTLGALGIAALALSRLKESFHNDLDYLEK